MPSSPPQILPDSTPATWRQRVLANVPAGLVGLRVAIAPLLLWDSWDHQVGASFLVLYIVAVLSDIFDGIIARRLGVSTAALRQADSWADNVFYISVFLAVWRVHPEIVLAWRWPLLSVLACQILWWGINLAKYGKPASYHTYSAKAWGLALVMATIAVFGFHTGGWPLGLAVGLGIVHSVEEMVMTLILPTWQHDVLSVWHAWQLRSELVAASVAERSLKPMP